jgi:hypothetical protein
MGGGWGEERTEQSSLYARAWTSGWRRRAAMVECRVEEV